MGATKQSVEVSLALSLSMCMIVMCLMFLVSSYPGHVEEAFLDLTGAPTIVYNFDHHNFNARQFWGELVLFRKKRLPMGCGTSTSQGGIVGGHAYSGKSAFVLFCLVLSCSI